MICSPRCWTTVLRYSLISLITPIARDNIGYYTPYLLYCKFVGVKSAIIIHYTEKHDYEAETGGLRLCQTLPPSCYVNHFLNNGYNGYFIPMYDFSLVGFINILQTLYLYSPKDTHTTVP